MTELPSSWTTCPIGEVLVSVEMTAKDEPDRDIWYVDISSIDNQSNKIVDPKRIALSAAPSRARQKIISGDTLFSTVRPYLRKIAAVPEKYDGEIASTGFAVLRPAEGIHHRYIFYKAVSHDFVSALTGEQYGVSYPAVKEEQVRSQELQLPPTNEQRRIVERIEGMFDEIDHGVENLKKARATLGLYRQSLLKSAFEGRLTADWRAGNTDKLETPETLLARIQQERETRYKSALDDWQRALTDWRENGEEGRKPSKPKRLPDFAFAESEWETPWPAVRVDAILRAPLINGRSVKDRSGGFPVLRLTALKNGRIDLVENKEGNWSHEDAEPFLVEEDDIFLARGNGSKKLVGIGGRVMEEPFPVAFPDTMIRVRLDPGAIRADFFLLAWNSWTVRSQIESAARTTAGIYKINQDHVSSFILPLPSLTEQAEITRILDERLSAADALEAEIDAGLTRAQALRQSILKQAFSGKLVPQDADDEPAADLLERIKVEKKEREKSAKGARKSRSVRAAEPRRLTLTDLLDVLKQQKSWIPASKAIEGLGLGDGASSDDIEAFYHQLKQYVESSAIEIERRGYEDWLRLVKVEAK